MSNISKDYTPLLNVLETNKATIFIRNLFKQYLCKKLHLTEIVSPSIIESGNGFQDDLNGIERPVKFDIPFFNKQGEILQDNCKWRRAFLSKNNFPSHTGIYATLDCGLRRDESILDNTHSIIINNATWEIVIDEKDRTIKFLQNTVKKIMKQLYLVQEKLNKEYPKLKKFFTESITFLTSQELENLYPNLSPSERETEWTKTNKNNLCVMKIGYPLNSGKPHDKRSPDYDDWELNFDILVYYSILDKAIEIGGGGIRVTKDELIKQCNNVNYKVNLKTNYHQSILNDLYKKTMGGAFGGDRICMIMLNKCHIGEIRPSIWDNDTISKFKNIGIDL